jgi:tRNA threonylcarbamoyladenosine biosynthesis protein TsaE
MRLGSLVTAPELRSASPAETEAIAAALARELEAGDVVTVSGELGAGKTTFVRGACRALGVTGSVTSPTYTIGHRYDEVSHLDLYRIDELGAEDWAALEPYFEDAICFVEWPERGVGWLPPARAGVTLRHLGPDRRLVLLESGEEGLFEGICGGGDSRL